MIYQREERTKFFFSFLDILYIISKETVGVPKWIYNLVGQI